MLLSRLNDKEALGDGKERKKEMRAISERKGHVPFQISVKDTPEPKVLHLHARTSDSDLGCDAQFPV